MKKTIKSILEPNKVIGFFLFNLGFGLLIYVFSCHLEDTPIAYISYLLSSYALIVFCIWFYKVCKFSNNFIKKSKVYNYYKTNTILFNKTSMYISFFFNLSFGIFKLIIGIFYKSWWFITFAIYYLLLCFMRLSLIKNINNQEKERKKIKHTGFLLLFLNLILSGIIILILKTNQIINYNGYLIYLIALYDFYVIINAIISVLKYRKNHNPIIASSKCINLTVAMISMISLEVAMIYQFGNNDTYFKSLTITLTGLAICLINSFMAIYMIIKGSKK